MSDETAKSDAPDLAGGRAFWIVVAVGTGVLLVIWLLIPWQWAPVDDAGQVLAMRDLFHQHGVLGGILTRIGDLAAGDRTGGVFRPVAWVYPPLFYWLPVRIAHALRLLMIIVIVVGPLIYFRRRGAGLPRLWMTFFLLAAAAATLYQGLLLLSLQEVGGMLFVAAGLMTDRRALRLVLWTLAAWFKGPFSWLLIGNSFVLWREGRRRLAVASASLGVGTLAVNYWWSRGGDYTSRYRIDPLDPELWKSAGHILEPVNAVLLVSVLWWVVVTQTRLERRPDFWIFAVGFGGYYLQMIPWGFTAYYMGPISFLLGLLLACVLTDPKALSLPGVVTGLVVPMLVAAWLVRDSVSFVLRTNAVMSQAGECLSSAPGSSTVVFGDWLYVASSPEGPYRIEQNTGIFHDGWTGTVRTENNSVDVFNDPSTTHALSIDGAQLPSGRTATMVCDNGLVRLYSLS